MVKKWIFIFLILPLFLASAEFTASVHQNKINSGESLILTLTLKDASPKGNPSLEPLKKNFAIHSEQKQYQTKVINGQSSSNITWKIQLTSLNSGNATIPSLTIDSSEGKLSTIPIAIQVSTARNQNVDSSDVILSTDTSDLKPYKNQAFNYTVTLISKQDLTNINMQSLEIEDAIVELASDPKMVRKIIDGVSVNVIEVNYIITPLKAGALKIPSIAIQGALPVRRSSSFADEFSFFGMQGFDRLKPFVLTTEETVLEVLPPIPGINPWLPAKAIVLEEVFDSSQTFQVGEPFTRSFKISAEGLKASQLPSIKEQMPANAEFKVYADKPELIDENQKGKIKSYRKEELTIIPQTPGTLTLPEISLTWFDISKNEKSKALIPARTLHVLPSLHVSQPIEKELPQVEKVVIIKNDPYLYGIIAALAILLLFVSASFLWLAKKVKDTQVCKVSLPPSRKSKKEKLPDLNPT